MSIKMMMILMIIILKLNVNVTVERETKKKENMKNRYLRISAASKKKRGGGGNKKHSMILYGTNIMYTQVIFERKLSTTRSRTLVKNIGATPRHVL